ncbi:epsin-2 isoform X2 [Euwallacea similis]|uniref:epsin-2 isoform X2 n=1 Tax=Euwallacea similis TaxID=1736056 RepID=UPI00344C9268
MRRSSNDMQVNVAGIRRNLKNIAHNYSDAQRKVREATSNDPWGPSSTIMAEIADLTYNVVAFSEIMQMVWKRLNDHGKNWRHVYKALVLLEYLIKTGSEKVAQQCKENIYAIQTLKDFQHLEEGKDQGSNVREKAKQLVNLLKDDDRLKNERARALKAKERFAQSASGFGSDGGLDTPTSPRYPAFRGEWSSRDSTELPRDIEVARPQTAGEEELQLQLALAMSREEADQEEQKRKSDDVRLQLALSQSQQDFKKSTEKLPQSHLVDLLDVNLGSDPTPVDPWGMPQPPRPQESSPWQSSSLSSPPRQPDPWQPAAAAAQALPSKSDPWGLPPAATVSSNLSPVNTAPDTAKHDPWSPTSPASSTDLDEFDIITNRNRAASPKSNGNTSNDPFELNLLGDTLSSSDANLTAKKTPHSFLGENSALVNLDNLVTTSKLSNPTLAANPFSDVPQVAARPVFNTQPPKPSINEIKQQTFANQFGATPPPQPGFTGFAATSGYSATIGLPTNKGSVFNATAPLGQPDPWTPVPTSTTLNGNGNVATPWMKTNEPANPFLS